jgi:uncharacterized protein YqgC (DUF456 family)
MASALIITLFLFFVDEGFYNYQWMSNGDNWIAFGIYFLILFLGQFLTYLFISKVLGWHKRMFLSNTLGSILGMFLAFGVLFS